jgi:hypothetical protein
MRSLLRSQTPLVSVSDATRIGKASPLESTNVIGTALNLRVGDVVEVRSRDEILRTLDERGTFESLPFMPEMLKYCP